MGELAYEEDDLDALLAPYEITGHPRYTKAPWLKTDFDDPIWWISSQTSFKIDWRVRLEDGLLLTDSKHTALWNTFRSWLVAQTHVDVSGGQIYAKGTESNLIYRGTHCIDFFLVRSARFRLAEGGFEALTRDQLKSVLFSIASNRRIGISVYQWPSLITSFLREQLLDPSASTKQLSVDTSDPLPTASERLTSLSDEEIVLARAWLAQHGLYKRALHSFRWVPDRPALARQIFANTLCGHTVKMPLPKELCLGSEPALSTEKPRARVTAATDDRMSRRDASRYVRAFEPLALLSESPFVAPAVCVDSLHHFVGGLDLKPNGRFRTLPHDVVMGAVRASAEFALEYGDSIVDSYLRVSKMAHQLRCPPRNISQLEAWDGLIDEKLLRFGVTTWSMRGKGIPHPGATFYERLRSNPGLYDCLILLYGSTQVIIGALMARRESELTSLIAGKCLDESGTRLVFQNRKSGVGDYREWEVRPIPPIGVRLIKLIERLHTALVDLGIIEPGMPLLSAPRRGAVGLTVLTSATYRRVLDLFCDWSQTPLDSEGRRHYLRQHQFRRFFAMLFFYGGGFGGMDVLRWFLGHTDTQHLWHYITETIPGEVLRSVAADFAAYQVRHHTEEGVLLSEVLEKEFGATQFALLDDEALSLYLETLIVDGRLSVEPQFLDGGRRYRVAVRLTETGASA